MFFLGKRIKHLGNFDPNPHRIAGIDLARSIAIFGMIIVNFSASSEFENPEPLWISMFLNAIEGRAAATFIVVAGIGIALMKNKTQKTGDSSGILQLKKNLLKRALFLFAVGLSYTKLWPPDILHFYGVFLPLGILFLQASNRKLLAGIFFFILAFPVLSFFLDYDQGWDYECMAYTDFWSSEGMIRHLFFNGYFPVFPWGAFLLAGIWLGRQDLNHIRFRRKVLITSMLILMCSEILSAFLTGRFFIRILGEVLWIDFPFLGRGPYPPNPLFILSGGSAAFVAITVCMELGNRFGSERWIEPFIAIGQSALTIYLAHVFAGMAIFEFLEIEEMDQPLTPVLTFGILFYLLAASASC